VVQAGQAAERAGLRIGDVVFGVDQSRIGSLEEFYRLVSHRRGKTLALLVRRANSDLYVTLDFSSGWPDGNRARDTLLRT
jgi:S1-C subfamily serine protease